MAYFPHEFPLFTKLSDDLLKQKAYRIANCLGDIPSILGISGLLVSEDCIAEIVQELYYSFRYRDLSKEAIMNLAESLIY
jgi:hypothetical protein